MQDPAFKRSRSVGRGGWVGRGDLAGAAHMELVSGVVQLRPEDAMVEAMLRGWRAQQTARGMKQDTMVPRERLIRRYQCTLRLFTEFLIDGRCGWAVACEQAFGPGRHPVAIAHEWNTIAHLNDYEGNPEARPFTREEVQRFLDYADEQVEHAVKSKRKGALAAYRDATLFKVIYGWGLRRTETAKLDLVDFGRNPAAPEFGRYGMLNVRYGKAKKGQPPRID